MGSHLPLRVQIDGGDELRSCRWPAERTLLDMREAQGVQARSDCRRGE